MSTPVAATRRFVQIAVLIFLVAPALVTPLAAGDNGSASDPVFADDSGFLTVGTPGTGTQQALLGVSYDPPPPAGDAGTPEHLGYDQVNWTPAAALIPSGGLATMLSGVDACAFGTRTTLQVPCGALVRANSCANLQTQEYCLRPDGLAQGSLWIDLGFNQAATRHQPYPLALHVHLNVARQSAAGIVTGSTLTLRNPQWTPSDHTPVLATDFATQEIALVRIAAASDCSAQSQLVDALTTDMTLPLYALGVSRDGACTGLVSVHWTIDHAQNGKLVGSDLSSSIVFDATAPGNVTISADDGLGHSNHTGVILIAPGQPAAITLRLADGSPATNARTMSADDLLEVLAFATDADGNVLSPAPVAWSVLPADAPCGRVLVPAGPATIFDAQLAHAANCRIQAAPLADAAPLGSASTGLIDVAPGMPVGMQIRADPNAGPALGAFSIKSSTFATLYLAGLDLDGNAVPLAGTWSVVNDCGALETTTGTSVRFQAGAPTMAGTIPAPLADCHLRAALDATLSDVPVSLAPIAGNARFAETGAITVTAGDPAFLLIRTAAGGAGTVVHTLSMTAGTSRTLYAAGYDQDLLYVGDVLAAWTTNDTTKLGVGATGASTLVDALHSGAANVTATVGDAKATANVAVAPGPLASILLRVGPGASAPTPPSMIEPATTLDLHAAGYDAQGDALGDITSTWTLLAPCGSLTPNGGTASFTSSYRNAPGCGVRADGTDGVNATASFTIHAPALAAIVIRDAANGGGAAIPTTETLAAGSELSLYAAGYDAAQHYLGDVDGAIWSLNDTTKGSITQSSGATTTLLANRTGVVRVSATTGIVTGATPGLSIVPGPMTHIEIADATNTTMPVIGVPVGASLTVYSVGRDDHENFVRLVDVTWSLQRCPANPAGALDGVSPACAARLSSTVGTFTTLRGDHSGADTLSIDDSAGHQSSGDVTVAGLLDHIVLEMPADVPMQHNGIVPPAPAVWTMTADDTLTLRAEGYDAQNVALGPVAVNWSSLVGNFSPTYGGETIFDARLAIDGTIQAADGKGHSASFPVSIKPGKMVAYDLAANVTSAVAGVPVAIVIAPVDADDNAVLAFAGNVTFTTSDAQATLPGAPNTVVVTHGAGQSVPGFVLGTAGNQTITVTDVLGRAKSALLPVTPGALASFTLDQNIGSQVAGVAFTLHATALDRYHNVATGFTGTATLGGAASWPASTPAFAGGLANVSVYANASATAATISVTSPGATGSTNSFPVVANVLDHFAFANLPAAGAQATLDLTLDAKAQDAFNNTVTGFTGSPTATGNLGAVTVNSGLPFAAGLTTLHFKVDLPGTWRLTLTSGTKTGTSATFVVVPGPLDHLDVATIGTQIAGAGFSVVVTARDAANNVRYNDNGSVSFVDSLGATITPASGTLASGVATTTITMTTPLGTRHITATEGAKSKVSNDFALLSGPATHWAYDTGTGAHTAGDTFTVTFHALDQWNNANTTLTGTPTLAESCSVASASGSVANGLGSVTLRITVAGGCTLTPTLAGAATASPSISINAGPVTHVAWTQLPTGAVDANTTFTAKLTALDAFENVATNTASQSIKFGPAKRADDGMSPTVNGNAVLDANGGAVAIPISFTNGVATLTILLPNATAQTLNATDSSFAKVQSAMIQVAPGAEAQIAILLECTPTTYTHACVLTNGRAPITNWNVAAGQDYHLWAVRMDWHDNVIASAISDWQSGSMSLANTFTKEDTHVTWDWPAAVSATVVVKDTVDNTKSVTFTVTPS